MDKLLFALNYLGKQTMNDMMKAFDMFGDCEIEQLLDIGTKVINECLLDKPINDWTEEERSIFVVTECAGQIVCNRKKELNRKLDIM